jgi:hypothetical protein
MKKVVFAFLAMVFVSMALAEEHPQFRVFLIQHPELRANCVAERIVIDSGNVIAATGETIVAIACKGDLVVRKDGVSKPLADVDVVE